MCHDHLRRATLLLVMAVCVRTAFTQPEECSTLIAGGLATVDGRPILWKNRDTDNLRNRVVLVREQPYSYLALVDDDDTTGRVAWGGVNAAGFAVCNSVAYNLPHRSGDLEDLEGMIMADALRTCASVADFEQMLVSRQGRALGARTNFCVMDAQGGASILETHNRGVHRLDVAAPDGWLVNTNYSRSGTPGAGSGYMRFERETELLDKVPDHRLSVEYLVQTVVRDLGHRLLRYPARSEWKTLDPAVPTWLYTNHCINRGSTAATMVVQGVRPGEDPAGTTFWVMLGEPVTTVAIPLWANAGPPPATVRRGQVTQEALRLKARARPKKEAEYFDYLDVTQLDNRSGSGWLPRLLEEERGIMKRTRTFEAQRPDSAAKAAFQEEVAARVMEVLKAVR